FTLSESAYSLAESGGGNGRPYQEGMAFSLRTQGYINQRLGNHSTGLVQLMRAKETFESLGIIDGLPDVYDGIAGIYFQIGSFPNALLYVHRQLDAAKQIGNKRLIANAYNNYAVIYIESEDYEQGEATRDECLKLAIESGHTRIECISYINIAETRLRTGKYEQALKFGSRALKLSRDAGFELFEIYSWDILGKTYLKLGERDKGLKILESVLALSKKIDAKPSECMVLLSLGEAFLEIQQPDQAVVWLEQSLNVAQVINASVEVYKTYEALSKAYEQKKNYADALAYFKQYQAIRGQVLSSVETLRTKILDITYQTEAAKKEAEIEHFRAIELEREVEERTAELTNSIANLKKEVARRKQAEAEIQQMVELLEERVAARSRELAALYDMTILLSDVESLADTLKPALGKIMRNTDANGIAVHILSASQRSMQLAARLGLGELEQFDEVPLANDFVHWLKQADAPLMFVAESDFYPMLPNAFLLPPYATFFGIALRVHGQTIGFLSLYRDREQPFSFEHVSLLITMAEQLGIIIQNHRLQEQSLDMTRVLERQRLARELHDSVAQRIYSLHLFARAGHDALEDSDIEATHLRLQQVEANALFALREMRLLLYQLRPLALESNTLSEAFENRFEEVERRLGIQAVVETDHAPGFSEEVEEEVFYIVTEALNNALKHAEATDINLLFTTENGRSKIIVRDNGSGFDLGQKLPGLGLENMCLRSEKINGLVTIDTAVGQGTTVNITL
ncbi:MAG: tetratricopeptide repeat protein, partial [Candidatus Promineifilaceae bacterium]|nr:tetratricopeptide repeat protein [Candidatus Promineifilaceae bacterium]